jgi:hypothetical protein
VERSAGAAGVTLLMRDTQTGSAAELPYTSAGWTRVGTVPDSAADPACTPRPTAFFYKKVG